MAIGVWREPHCVADDLSGAQLQKEKESNQRPYYSRSVTCHANCQVHFGAEKAHADDANDPSESVAKPTNNNSLPPVEERDLCQQARMAWWTRIIAYFTALGAGLLFWTLWETRRDIAETRKIGEAQTRGYISTSNMRLLVSDEDGKPKIEFQVLNSGQTPIYDLKVAAYIGFTPRDDAKPVERLRPTKDQLFVDIFASATIPNDTPQTLRLKYGPWMEGKRASRVMQDNKVMHYVGILLYRDVFGQRWAQNLYYLMYAGNSAGEWPTVNFVLNNRPRKVERDDDIYSDPQHLTLTS